MGQSLPIEMSSQLPLHVQRLQQVVAPWILGPEAQGHSSLSCRICASGSLSEFADNLCPAPFASADSKRLTVVSAVPDSCNRVRCLSRTNEINMPHSMCSACGGDSSVSIENCDFCRSQFGESENVAVTDCELRMDCLPDCICSECLTERTKRKSTLVILLVGACVSLLLSNFMAQSQPTSTQYTNKHRNIDLFELAEDPQPPRVVLGQQDGSDNEASLRMR